MSEKSKLVEICDVIMVRIVQTSLLNFFEKFWIVEGIIAIMYTFMFQVFSGKIENFLMKPKNSSF